MAVWQFNRGEWTEAYVFLRLLGDGRIYGANDNLEKDELTYIDIINIIKDEPNQYLRFERFMDEEIAQIQAIDSDECVFKVVTAPELQEKASFLFNSIKTVVGERKIRVPSIEEYLKEFRFTTPKANLSEKAREKYGAKADIVLTSLDSLDHTRNIVGFSIKSHLGSSPTLFNCSSTSGFVYKIIGCDESSMHNLNYLDSFKDIISQIKRDYQLELVGCKNEAFAQNISVVDSQMEEILSTAVLIHSGFYGESTNEVKSIGNILSTINPINLRNPQIFYTAKLKELLFDSFAGMTASTIWNGRKKITGGYIDVSRNGEMLYYRAISDDVFFYYLLNYTYFDRPDRGYKFKIALEQAKAYIEGRTLTKEEIYNLTYKYDKKTDKMVKRSPKGDFGYVYCKEGEYYIDINFQIRFR